MLYQDFIKCIEQQGSKNIEALHISESCSTRQIPVEILHLFPEIIQLLEKNLAFCRKGQTVVLFGLQPCTIAIQSSFPITSKRIFDLNNPYMHFCCVLQYFFAPKSFFHHDFNEKKTQSLIIDFTTGFIMDNQLYFSKVFSLPEEGLSYGNLNQSMLKAVWLELSKGETMSFKKNRD